MARNVSGTRFFANLRRLRRVYEICSFAGAHDCCVAVRFHQDSRLFVNCDFTGNCTPAVFHNACQKSQGAAHPVALGKMRVSDHIFEQGHFEEITYQSYTLEIRILQHL
jgi:hypothetical protein